MAYTGKRPGNVNTDFLDAGGELANHDEVTVDASGNVTATSYIGDGSSLTGLASSFDSLTDATVSTTDPTVSTNPSATGHLWLNKTTGEMYACTDNTAGANVWTNAGDGKDAIKPIRFGDSSWGSVTLGSSSLTQADHTVAANTVFTATAAGASSYSQATPTSGVYELIASDIGSEVTTRNSSGSNTDIFMDGDMVVANFKDLTVDAGVTLTTNHPCRGLLVFVDGNLTLNGKISMTARGAVADPDGVASSDGSAVDTAGLIVSLPTASGTSSNEQTLAGCGVNAVNADFGAPSSNRTLWAFSKLGGSGGVGSSSNNPTAGGTSATSTGGGGAGGSGYTSSYGMGGHGTQGTCFSGGSAGGGGTWRCTDTASNDGDSGITLGGAGGAGGINTSTSSCYTTGEGGGGAGNPAGYNGRWGGWKVYPNNQAGNSLATIGDDGTGGLLIVIVTGNITGTGTLEAKGSAGGAGDDAYGYDGGGGGSGGGIVGCFYSGTTSSPSLVVTGGAGGSRSGSCGANCSDGKSGGNGYSITAQFDGS